MLYITWLVLLNSPLDCFTNLLWRWKWSTWSGSSPESRVTQWIQRWTPLYNPSLFITSELRRPPDMAVLEFQQLRRDPLKSLISACQLARAGQCATQSMWLGGWLKILPSSRLLRLQQARGGRLARTHPDWPTINIPYYRGGRRGGQRQE